MKKARVTAQTLPPLGLNSDGFRYQMLTGIFGKLDRDHDCQAIMASKGPQIRGFLEALLTIENLGWVKKRIQERHSKKSSTEPAFHCHTMDVVYEAIALSEAGRRIIAVERDFYDAASKISPHTLTAFPFAQGQDRRTSFLEYMVLRCYDSAQDHIDYEKKLKEFENTSMTARAYYHLASVLSCGIFLMVNPSFHDRYVLLHERSVLNLLAALP